MPYDEILANRVREIIATHHQKVEEKKMFGGLCFMVNKKMFMTVRDDRMLVRFDPEIHDEIMEKEGCRPMNFTGKIMKGYVYVDIEAVTTKKKLDYWVNLAQAYNKKAKASKKKK